MQELTSRENKLLKLVRSLQSKKGRIENGLYFAEGRRMADEALTYAYDRIEMVLVSDSFVGKHSDYIRAIEEGGKTLFRTSEKLFKECCDTETPQGIGVLLRMENKEPSLPDSKFLLVLDGVSEPGNLGTIVRTAEAVGVDGILLMKGCADLYNPKVVRSTMGSLFRVPCMTGVAPEYLTECKRNGFFVTATALYDSVSLADAVKKEKQMLVIGSEAAGVSKEVLSLADQCIRIPMAGKVESLNAAVAAGIAMYGFRQG